MKYLRSPWIPAALILAISAIAYVEQETMTNRDKFIVTVIFVMLSVYIVEALTKKKP